MLFYVFGRISGDESRDAVMNHRSSAASSPHKRLHGEEDEEEELQVLDFPKSTKMVFFLNYSNSPNSGGRGPFLPRFLPQEATLLRPQDEHPWDPWGKHQDHN